MADEILKIDANDKPVAGFVTDDSSQFIRNARIDDTTKGLKVMIVGGVGGGTVTSVSVVSANGFAGTVATATTTPAITLSTTNTSGSVLFAGTAGQLQQDNANLFWDDTNNRLGIGNSSPAQPLDVTGIIRGSQNLILSGSGANQGIGIGGTTFATSDFQFTYSGTSLLINNVGAARAILIGIAGVEKFRVHTNGFVGINVAAPTAVLHLLGGTATAGTASLKINSGTLLGTTEAGAIENDGTHLYYTAANAGTRFQLDQQGGGGLTVGTTTIASGTTTRVLFDNGGVLGEYVISGTGNVAMTTSPVFTTPSLGVATATSINGNTFTTGTYTLTGQAGKTLTFNGSITLTGTDAQTYTFPTTSATLARTDAANTFTGVQTMTSPVFNTSVSGTAFGTGVATWLTTPSSANLIAAITDETGTGALVFATSPTLVTPLLGTPTSGVLTNCTGLPAASVVAGTFGTGAYTMDTKLTVPQVINTANAITASGNAATVPVTQRHNIVTNNSAATLTITLTTASAVNMQMVVVQILDFSAVAQTLTLVNTENSTITAPTTTNGSTTLPLTLGFIFNSATTKWRLIASA